MSKSPPVTTPNLRSKGSLISQTSGFRYTAWEIERRARLLSRVLFRGRKAYQPSECDPEDVQALGAKGGRCYRREQAALSLGSLETSRRLLQIIEESFPTPTLSEAYLTNLSIWLESREARTVPGRLVIGLGTGRSGSTTLAARLRMVSDSCSTHENPPLLFWSPAREQIDFHMRRFAMLKRHYLLVADCAHWWLNVVDDLVAQFPDVKLIGLVRDRFECVVSFARLKGIGRGTYNHWARNKGNMWIPTLWDPTYPAFETPDWAERDPDRAKLEMIERYWETYNARLTSAAAKHPNQFLLLSTKQLNEPQYIEKIYSYVGLTRAMEARAVKLNVKTTRDGRHETFRV